MLGSERSFHEDLGLNTYAWNSSACPDVSVTPEVGDFEIATFYKDESSIIVNHPVK